MRVLIAHGRYRFEGGEERHVELLMGELGRRGVDVSLWSPQMRTPTSSFRRAALAAGLIYRPSSARTVSDLVNRFEPDIVHFHNLMPQLTPAATLAAHRAGAKVVLTAHNYRLFCPNGTMLRHGKMHDSCVRGSSFLCGLRGARDSWLESVAYGAAIEVHRRLNLVARSVHAFISPSQFLAKLLAEAGFPADRIHVINYGVPITSNPHSTREFALYAGRLTREKGVETLIRAVRGSGVPLKVAGDGPLRSLVEESAQRGEISYEGHLGGSELRELRRRAAFLVAPSECSDNLPLTILEALADGLPVLLTREGGLTEIAERGGCRSVQTANATALRQGLGEMWEFRATSDLGEEALTAAQRYFELSARTADVINLYESLLR